MLMLLPDSSATSHINDLGTEPLLTNVMGFVMPTTSYNEQVTAGPSIAINARRAVPDPTHATESAPDVLQANRVGLFDSDFN